MGKVLAVTTWKPVELLCIDADRGSAIAVYEDGRYIGLATRDDVAKLIFG